MKPPARKPAQPTAGAKPNATAEDKCRAERLWELYTIAFQGLLAAHCCVTAEEYSASGDREWESARAIAGAAMTLAISAEAKWQAHERSAGVNKRRAGKRANPIPPATNL